MMLEKFYPSLLTTQAVRKCTDKKYAKYTRTVAPETIKRIHKLLHSCFNQAVRWELVNRNPVTHAAPPESQLKELDGKGVIFAFPVATESSTAQLVLKRPKTLGSTRKVFLPETVAKIRQGRLFMI